MKKTVFLFLLTIIFIFNINHKVIGSEVNYQVNNNEFIVTSIEEDGIYGFTIEKTGVNPFYSKVIDSSEHYFITGVKEVEDYYILFGYGFSSSLGTEYDSLYFVLDVAGNIIKKDLRDYGSMETIKDVYYIDDIFIVLTESVIDIDYSFEFKSNFFTSFDHNFNFLDSIEINSEIYKTEVNDTYILVGYNKEEYDLGIRSDLTLIQKNDILPINEGEIYTDPVTIEFINGATLNNDYIENGTTVSYPGNYTLNYNNKIYNFSIKPVISGVMNGEIYNESVFPNISGGNIILNNDVYVLGTEINNPGNYELTINGANNYSDTVKFTITSNLKGVINNNIYLEPVNISFNGDGYLNDNYIQSPYEVTESGEYILKVKGANNYTETYYFSIQDEVKKASMIDFVQKVDIIVLVVVLISGGIILKKK
jgi:hypothetical protein